MSPVKVKNTLAGFTTVLCPVGAELMEDWEAAMAETGPEIHKAYPYMQAYFKHRKICKECHREFEHEQKAA